MYRLMECRSAGRSAFVTGSLDALKLEWWYRRVIDLVMCGLLFFFFQAEDGIRDLTVTGVQTCALPISRLRFIFLLKVKSKLSRVFWESRNCACFVRRSSKRSPRRASSSETRQESRSMGDRKSVV